MAGGGGTRCIDQYDEAHDTAELYNPDTGIWRLTGSLSRRVYHSATLLPNGQVLVVGGVGGPRVEDDLNTAELYDPVTEVSRPTQSTIAMRGGNSALLLSDGRVLAVSFFGGRPVAELFDPSTESWRLTNPPSVKGWASLALLPSGLVLAANENSSELYDPATGMWSRRSNLRAIEYVQTLPYSETVRSSRLEVVILGARQGRSFRSATGTWQFTSQSGSEPNFGTYTATLMPNGRVLVAGGADEFLQTHRSIELYDPAAGVWNPMPSLVVPRDYHTATLLANDKVLFAAGFEGEWYWFPTFYTSTELFDLGLRARTSRLQCRRQVGHPVAQRGSRSLRVANERNGYQ